MIKLLLEKTEVSISQPLSAPNTFYIQGVHWEHKSSWWWWEMHKHKKQQKSFCYFNISTHKFQIIYRKFSVESYGEETCEQTGLKKWYFHQKNRLIHITAYHTGQFYTILYKDYWISFTLSLCYFKRIILLPNKYKAENLKSV
jgi:hypothetical protein